MVGVNPEVAHETMCGLPFHHAVAQAWEAGKLFHIDLNDQKPGRYDQDHRFGSENLKGNFFLVKFLEEAGYSGMRHFDAHAYRTESPAGVKDFARGCMRSYLILKEKAARFQEDAEIQEVLRELTIEDAKLQALSTGYSGEKGRALKEQAFDREEIARHRLPYERLDQLVIELLLGVR
jgi:xylose isomerase